MEDSPQYLTKPVEIRVPLFDSKKFTIIESLDDRIILHEKHIECMWKCTLNETDEDAGITKEKKYHGNKSMMKNKIISVGCAYIDSQEHYELTVEAHKESEYTIRFKTFSEALEVKNKILQWLIH